MNAAMEMKLRVFASFRDKAIERRIEIINLSAHPEETRALLRDLEQNIHFLDAVFHEELKKLGFMSRQEAEIAVNLMRGGSIYGR